MRGNPPDAFRPRRSNNGVSQHVAPADALRSFTLATERWNVGWRLTSLQKQLADLAPLDSFDPAAFVGDSDVPQELCNLVLTLALIYNDYKDISFAADCLQNDQPSPPQRENQGWGEWTGIYLHTVRLTVGLVHELLNLIADNPAAVANPFFISVLNRLDKRAREAWDTLADAALNSSAAGALGKALLLIRNKVAFHYDPKEVYRGYDTFFLKGGKTPYLSRGRNMRETRFYFADAAALGYLNSRVDGGDLSEFFKQTAPLLKSLNFALFEIVDRFIQRRGFAWRRVEPP